MLIWKGLEGLFKAGQIFKSNALYDEAISYFNQVQEDYPESDAANQAYIEIGLCELSSDKINDAQSTFQKAKAKFGETEPGFQAQLELGKILLQKNQLLQARAEFSSIVNFQSSDYSAQAQYWIGETYFAEDDYSKAAIEYLKIKYLFPGVENWIVRGIFQAAQANEKLQRYGEARKLYRSIIEQYKDEEFSDKAKQQMKEIAGK